MSELRDAVYSPLTSVFVSPYCQLIQPATRMLWLGLTKHVTMDPYCKRSEVGVSHSETGPGEESSRVDVFFIANPVPRC